MSKLLISAGFLLAYAGSTAAMAQEASMQRNAQREWRAASQYPPGSVAANADAAIANAESQWRAGGK